MDSVREGRPPDARGGFQILGTGTRPTVWPRSVRRRCLRLGRNQVDECPSVFSVCLQFVGDRHVFFLKHHSRRAASLFLNCDVDMRRVIQVLLHDELFLKSRPAFHTIQCHLILFLGPTWITVLVTATSVSFDLRPVSTLGACKRPWISLFDIVNAPVFVCMS